MAYSALRTLVNRAGITFDALKTHVVFAEDMNQIKANIEYLESNRSALSTILNAANLGSGYLMRWDGSKLVNSKIYDNGTNVGIGTTAPLTALHIVKSQTRNTAYYDVLTLEGKALVGKEDSYGQRMLFRTNDSANGRTWLSGGISSFGNTDATNSWGNLEFQTKTSGASFTTGPTTKMVILENGNVGIATTSPTAKLDILSDILRLRTAKTPASAGAAGNAGDMCWDSGYLYICVSTNTWKRSTLATW